MINHALQFLLNSVLSFFLLALLLRFYLQLFRLPFGNPVGRFLIALTDFAVRPARRVIPAFRKIDMATLALAWGVSFVLLLTLSLLSPRGAMIFGRGFVFLSIAWLATVYLLRLSVYILMVAVVIQAVFSWVNPYHPLAPLLNGLTRPFLRPLQKRIPPIANVDLSPLILLIACQVALIVLVGWLESLAPRLF